MNSRTRILTAIHHQEPDHLPVDLGATPSSGISAIAYHNLRRHLGLSGTARVYDVVQQVAEPDEDILTRYRIDVMDVIRAFNAREQDWYPFRLPQGMEVRYPAWFKPVHQADGSLIAFDAEGMQLGVMPPDATFFDQSCFPYVDGYPEHFSDLGYWMGKVHWAALGKSARKFSTEQEYWAELRRGALDLRQKSERALLVGAGCNLFEWGTFLRRMDHFLEDLACDQANVERLLDALVEKHLHTLEMVCQSVGDVADIVRFGDDLGTDQGPFMSPATYRRLFKPRHKLMIDYVKQHSQLRPYLHSCGSIYKLLPDLIEAGFEIINPVQTSARDMQPERLKREFGSSLTFWGAGVDTRSTLNRGTPQQVKDEVQRNIETLSPGGGFVFNPVHNILPDVPPENIVAMFEAVDAYR